MKFSERKGLKTAAQLIQTDDMSDALRNSLWNVLDVFAWRRKQFMWRNSGEPGIDAFSGALWFEYFKEPIDSRPETPSGILARIREYFFSCAWYEVYDFLEWTLNHFADDQLREATNEILKRELAGYRFVSGVMTDITDEQEISSLEETLKDDELPGVRRHLEASLRLLSNRDSPDYRNSIKESISAVESMARLISGKRRATLGDALGVLERRTELHPALKQGFAKLYGYTNDEDGIRHAMLDEPNLDTNDAKFFLLSCTSFINYLKSKM